MAAAAIVLVTAAGSITISRQSDRHADLSTVATDSPTPTPVATAAGAEIRVTSDDIHLGDDLVGSVGGVAKDGGRTYVLAGRADAEPVDQTETVVLASFGDDGVERWRTELEGGAPSGVVVADGDPWVSRDDGTVTRIDASDGRVLGHITLEGIGGLVGAFGSVWATAGATPPGPGRLVRIDPDLSTTTIELSDCGAGSTTCPNAPVAGAGGIWVPLQDAGVAVVDPDTNQVTLIPVDDIGHEVQQVAVDGEVAYVASGNRVTSIVDGRPRATISPEELWYLGPMDGCFGLLGPSGRFQVLRGDGPMVVEDRQISADRLTGPVFEVDGEVWMETGRSHSLRRVGLLGVSSGR